MESAGIGGGSQPIQRFAENHKATKIEQEKTSKFGMRLHDPSSPKVISAMEKKPLPKASDAPPNAKKISGFSELIISRMRRN